MNNTPTHNNSITNNRENLSTFHDITNLIYINLDYRIDRRTHFESQFYKIGLHPHRFNAIRNADGAVGCTMSHIACMEFAIRNGWNHVLVCEDDATITNPSLLVHQVNNFLNHFGDEWDVLLLSGNNYHPFQKVAPYCLRVTNCQTTTSYLVRRPYFKPLLNNFKQGLTNLIAEPSNHSIFAIDQYWKHLQKVDRWYLIIPITVIQRTDYSDICKQKTDYTEIMQQHDK